MMPLLPRCQLPAYSPLSLSAVLRAARMLRHRPEELLRQRLVDYYGAKEAVLAGSGTEALTLALRAAAPPDGDPTVALPAYACFDVVSASVGAAARLLFYDIDPATLSPDIESLREVCAQGPDAVVVAPLYGIPVDWDAVRRVVEPSGAMLVEDAAQGVGASWHGRPLGSLGDLSVLSFGRGKGWTGGAGGAVLDHVASGRIPRPRARAEPMIGVVLRVLAQWLLGRPSVYWIPAGLPWLRLGETDYHAPREPRAMPTLSAALALVNEEPSRSEGEQRRRLALTIMDRLDEARPRGIDVVRPPSEAAPGFLRLPLLASEGLSTLGDERRARRAGIMPGYPCPLPDLPAARERALPGPPAPGAAHLARCLLTAPTHSLVGRGDLRRIQGLLAPS